MSDNLKYNAPEPLASFLWRTAQRGGRYALWFVLLGAGLGGLYGLLAGYLVGPALFVVVLCGVLAVLNAGVALAVLLLHLVLAPFGHGRRACLEYVVLSGSFLGVYLLFFGLLRGSGLAVF